MKAVRPLIAATLLALLSACASTAPSTPRAPARPGQVRPAARPTKPPAPRIQVAPGLEGVIGADRDSLIRQFGPARLDVWEGDARKLQFSGPPCVLDVYLYPPAKGIPPEATYVDARRASDGQDVDRAACIAALRRK